MKATIAATILLMSAVALPAYADQPGSDWISRERVAEILQQTGYGPIISMEAG